jgi:hypothetical protein
VALLALALLLVGFRIALPILLTRQANRILAGMPDYQGRVADIDLAVIRGAVRLKDIVLQKKGGGVPVPFLDVPLVEASIQWRELFRGNLVGEVHVLRPVVNLVAGPTREQSQTSISRVWIDTAKKYTPLRVNQFTVTDGSLRFRKSDAEPQVDVRLDAIQVAAENLANTRELQEERFGSVNATALVMNEANATLAVKVDPLAQPPRFSLEAEVQRLDLVRLNSLLRAYGNFDVQAGQFSVYAEIAADNGTFEGYAKPFFEEVKVFSAEEEHEGPLQFLWEVVVEGVKKILESEETGDVATRIPIQGRFEEPDVDVWTTIVGLLRNAFIQALRQGVEGSVGLGDGDEEEKGNGE